eukprot:TRINITY_DN12225_c0_g1_i1.p1 TRINITY_DN12225_c0_g1~~TRINITY_DN12225_c0_g1_i1.p1  ORF type:complete len:601 (+),score=160.69 TRINITY_DN12225_c0_g1_i1:151-1953(+)
MALTTHGGQGPQVSPVLMLRSVPQGATEKCLTDWVSEYQWIDPRDPQPQPKQLKCVKALVLSDKNIGFVQMQDVEEAKYLMKLFNEQPARISMARPDGTREGINLLYSDKQEIRAQGRARNQIPTSRTRILLVVLKELSHTIMMDELFWIFSQFGTVEKLSSFTKNMRNQVLVQYQTQEQASLAMAYLNGKPIKFQSPASPGQEAAPQPEGSCQFAIVPSKLPELTFKNQDQKNRDYKPINETLRWLFLEARQGRKDLKAELQRLGTQCSWRIRDFLWGVWVLGEGWLDPKQESPRHQGQIPVDPAAPGGKGIPAGQVGDCVHISGIPPLPPDVDRAQTSAAAAHSDPDSAPPHGGFNARMLWRLLGMHGEILAVKLLYKYPGCAIAQYKTERDASNVIQNMNHMHAFGKQWEFKSSKNANAMHWSGANTELQERMCTISDEGVCPPSVPQHGLLAPPCQTLVFSEIPPGTAVHDFETLFRRHELLRARAPPTIEIQGERAIVTFNTLESALLTVALLNGETALLGGEGSRLHIHFGSHRRQDAAPPAGVGHLQPQQGMGYTQTTPTAPMPSLPEAGAGTPMVATAQSIADSGLGRTWTC